MKSCFSLITRSVLATITLLSFPYANFGQAPDLGVLNNFVLYTTVGAVGSTGISNITGDVGSNDGDITNFDSLHGVIQNANTITAQCATQLLIVYNQLNGTIATLFPLPVLGNGQVLDSGIYSIPQAASLNGVLTLDAQGSSSAVFIFKIQGAFSTSANSTINLINGASANNIFWVVEGAASMATGTTIRGTVKDENGKTLAGANISVQGSSRGTISGANGEFALAIPDNNSVLIISYVGYASQEIAIGNSEVLEISLRPGISDLGEVVVVGYGTQRKRDITGSVKSLRTDDFNKGIITSPQQLLQGKVAGVNVTSVSGEPGGILGITIRGPGGVRTGSTPLFVVDGIPLDNSATGRGDPLNFLNPQDIESIDVLKDASATAIYGTRGANGVVIITTKKG